MRDDDEQLRMKCSRCGTFSRKYDWCPKCAVLLCATCLLPFYDGTPRHECEADVTGEEVRDD